MKLITTADWHLSPSRNRIDAEAGLNAGLMHTANACRFVIEDGIRRGGQILLHAGDLFDGCRPTPTEVFLARRALAPAVAVNMPMVLLLGNHDMPRNPHERHALDLVRDIPGVTVVDTPKMLYVYERFWEDDPERAATLSVETAPPPERYPGEVVQIACLPYPNGQLLLADERYRGIDAGERNLLIRDKLMDCARGLAAQRIDGVPSVLLAHGSVDTATAGAQNRLMMLGGDWTLNVHELDALGFDAVVLGHIHKPQPLMISDRRIIYYTGSVDTCDFGEQDESKEYQLMDLQADGVAAVDQIATPYRSHLTINLSGQQEPADELAEVWQQLGIDGAIVRVRLPQVAGLNPMAIRQQLEQLGAFDVAIETQRLETVRRQAAEITEETTLEPALRAWAEQRPETADMVDELLQEANGIESVVGGVA